MASPELVLDLEYLEYLEYNSYASFAVAAAVTYDYVLVLPGEIEYIWNQSWSWVSLLFLLVRYLGCFIALSLPVYYGIFPGLYVMGLAFYIMSRLAVVFFLAAADLVMILRAWAMYGKSKLILGILLVLYLPQIVFAIIIMLFTIVPNNLSADNVQVLGDPGCFEDAVLFTCSRDAAILQLIPGALTCILVAAQFVRQAFQMYQATKQWQLNRYMNLLFREGIIYFLITLAFCLVNLQDRLLMSFGVQWLHPVVVAASSILVLALTPRFILSIRALYARDVRGRQGYGIDTGFGFSSVDAGGGSAMVFADIRENEVSQQVEEIPMAGGIRSTQGDIAMC